jgi:predicted lipoprotein with Yx(FWY)xxD motif
MRAPDVVVKVTSAAAVAAVLLFATDAWAMHHEVKVAKGKDGSYLTDAKGMALYTFKKDTPGKSACAGDCVTRWPLYDQEKVGVTGDLKASDFATITREDGKKQTTYKGMPLYYFADDKAPGETKGQGVKEVWFLAKP